jgi:hypothetical protein
MKPLPTQCPISGGEIIVTRFYCPDSDITVEGRFYVATPFAQLTPEQVSFVEAFVRNSGKLNRMEEELGLSYPTIRSRLHDVILSMGYDPDPEPTTAGLSEEARRKILEDLDSGTLTAEEAMQLLQNA